MLTKIADRELVRRYFDIANKHGGDGRLSVVKVRMTCYVHHVTGGDAVKYIGFIGGMVQPEFEITALRLCFEKVSNTSILHDNG